MKNPLRQLLKERDLRIAFQPIWDLRNQAVLGYEALARPPAHYGFRGPEELFAAAHGSKLVHELDVLCFEAIVQAVKYIPDDVLLFVNITPETLEHPEFSPQRLTLGIHRRGFDPQRVVLEVTEREISDIERVVKRAHDFRAFGVKIALDDTGAGNAGLWMLSVLSVDYLKIDRSIVSRAVSDKACRAVLAGIVAIAHETGSVLIAEGVENPEMLQFVNVYGAGRNGLGSIQAVQGYLIARPELAGTPHVSESLNERVARGLELLKA